MDAKPNYDVVIIGAGMAGLYAAYNIKKMHPQTRMVVLERTSQRNMGGRAGTETFQGTKVVTGAGIGRKNKDVLLLKLMREMGLPIREFATGHHYPDNIRLECDVKSVFMVLRREYKSQSERKGERIHTTFNEFAKTVLEDELYKQFVTCVGYSDYENEDVYDTLYNYGFDDNYQPWIGFSVPWRELVEAMVTHIGTEYISVNSNVKTIHNEGSGHGFSITFEKNHRLPTITTRKLILATDIDSVTSLVPGAKRGVYQQIKGQPFLRLYGKFNKKSMPIMKKYASELMVVPGPIQKIIPMDLDKGVYMISYSDNRRAMALLKYLDNTSENRARLCRLLEKSLGIPKDECGLEMTDMMDFYWPIGTHYYQPLRAPFRNRQEFIKTAQTPFPNMLVVGEMVALNQGWVEGALDSVEKVITKKWLLDMN